MAVEHHYYNNDNNNSNNVNTPTSPINSSSMPVNSNININANANNISNAKTGANIMYGKQNVNSNNNNNNNNNNNAMPNSAGNTGNTGKATTSNNTSSDSTIVGLHYKIGKKIGEGSFGVLFQGVNMINGLPVAIKFEPRKSEAPQLKDEYRTYKILAGTPNIPQAYYFGQEGLHNILVIDLLGPSLEDLFEWCGRKFSVKTVVQVAVQMITLIEDLHAHDLIYRDIKPDNFLIGRRGQPDENQIHLIDFGMAKQYRDPKTKQHIPYREKKSLSGTARYMSINTHLGREQSRRDDMESLGHVFFYLLRGHLPWQGLKAPNNKRKYEKIGEKKRSTSVYDLAQGLPIQFGRYLEIVRNLGFDETPDYEGYRDLIWSVLDDLGIEADGEYDWMKLNGGRGWDAAINKKPNLHGYGHPNPPNEKQRRRKMEANNIHMVNHGQQQQLGQGQGLGKQVAQQYTSNQQLAHDQGQGKLLTSQGQEALQEQAPELDPTSFEAYNQQTQQKYSQQQARLAAAAKKRQQPAEHEMKPVVYAQHEEPHKEPQRDTAAEEGHVGFFKRLGCY